jgi:hypothetical protein
MKQPILETITITEYVDGELIANDYVPTILKNVKAGEFFTCKAGAKNKYMRCEYDKESKRYIAQPWEKGADKLLKGTAIVYIGFTY